MRRFRTASTALIVVLVLLSGCSSPRRRPNVILISLDACRADHLSCYGYSRPTSPFMDELASKGVRFSHAFVNTHPTPQAHTTILSSQYQETHKVNYDLRPGKYNVFSVPAHITMIQEILARHDYITLAVTDGGFLAGSFGFDRGFVEYHDEGYGVAGGTDRLIELVRKYRGEGRPFFVFYHTYEIHSPYMPPEEYRSLFGNYKSDFVPTSENLQVIERHAEALSEEDLDFVVAMYDGGIRYTDSVLRGLYVHLQELGFLEDCLIVVTADHGEEFGEHGGLLHHETLYEEVLRVPLILQGSSLRGGKVDSRMASSIDIVPTILEYVGIKGDFSLGGRSLLAPPVLPESDQAVFSQFSDWKYSIRTRDWKLIKDMRSMEMELYDLENDPEESRNLAAERRVRALELETRLSQWRERVQSTAQRGATIDLDEKQIQRLQALGYVEATTSAPSIFLPKGETIFGMVGTINKSKKPVVRSGEPVTVSGWAVHASEGAPIREVVLILDGVEIGKTETFSRRADVATAYGRADFADSGWQIDKTFERLAPGRYVMEARGVGRDGSAVMLNPLPFEVIP